MSGFLPPFSVDIRKLVLFTYAHTGVPIKCETKRNETKRNQQKRNETKRNQRNENEIKRNQRNQRKQNEIRC
jgi:hypothetical protein